MAPAIVSLPDTATDAPSKDSLIKCDVVIIGAGLGGIAALYHLQRIGLRCQVLEKEADIGGVWQRNRYPGARIDTGIPSYLLDMPECWKTWNWSCKHPDHEEIRRYLDHCDDQTSIRDHVLFNTEVIGAQFDTSSQNWITVCADRTVVQSKYLVSAVGITCSRSRSLDTDLASFEGDIYHPSEWPMNEVSPEGKDVAVIGTGCTGVQIVQTWGSKAKSLTLYQRSYNTALPLLPAAVGYKKESKGLSIEAYQQLLASRYETLTGVAACSYQNKDTLDDSPKEREALYRSLYDAGSLDFWLCGYRDLTTNPTANRLAHEYWAKRTREKIHNPRKRDLLAPLKPLYPFAAKRPALEFGFFEQFNQDSVDVVDIETNPIARFTVDGIMLADGTYNHHDIVIPAIGFTNAVVNITSLGIRSEEGILLKDIWNQRLRTLFGIMVRELPNMFIINGPQAPSEQSNLPTCIDLQVNWIADLLVNAQRDGVETIRPTEEAIEEWNSKVQAFNKCHKPTTSRCNSDGDLIFFNGGIPRYAEALERRSGSWEDFDLPNMFNPL
ncbi:hypothetical protein ASPZODRAFT_76183 [Penicilliopsis zonata CBS 506.65]|uniref:FAD/NAD(P)-binding domain-containing protein n=1 Tax=Penicilliopsis zonata CBS 506.65 TaxID=1073090 RepID=A0A1L9S6G9_9EURO|nr:hypothetical protein ASPZODRAFT_76183 [Penicilliopsis zonata CBS 506.65]OJJ42762.1 hypothetical protein ASPZODRAFT_76183 [Penicilliopsis zonata CBS 506.65]